MKRAKAGFSVIELTLVVAIALVITVMALPAIRKTITSYQLDASGRALASMLQQARMAAVKNNTPYYAQYNGAPGANIAFAIPVARLNPFTYNVSIDPTMAISNNVTFLAAGGAPPNHGQLETAMGVPVGAAFVQIGGAISFNGRGLPCTPNGTPWLCTNTPAAFEWFMQSNMTQAWEAVTVSPTGQIKAWHMSGNGVWQ